MLKVDEILRHGRPRFSASAGFLVGACSRRKLTGCFCRTLRAVTFISEVKTELSQPIPHSALPNQADAYKSEDVPPVSFAYDDTIQEEPSFADQFCRFHRRGASGMAVVFVLDWGATSGVGHYLTTQRRNLSVRRSDMPSENVPLRNHSLVTMTRTTNTAAFSSSQANTQDMLCSPMRPSPSR